MRRQGREHIARALFLQYSHRSSDSGYALIFFRQCAVLTEYWRQRSYSSGFALTKYRRFGQDSSLVRVTPSQNSGTLAVIAPLVRATPSHPLLPCASSRIPLLVALWARYFPWFGLRPHIFFFRALRARGAIARAPPSQSTGAPRGGASRKILVRAPPSQFSFLSFGLRPHVI